MTLFVKTVSIADATTDLAEHPARRKDGTDDSGEERIRWL